MKCGPKVASFHLQRDGPIAANIVAAGTVRAGVILLTSIAKELSVEWLAWAPQMAWIMRDEIRILVSCCKGEQALAHGPLCPSAL